MRKMSLENCNYIKDFEKYNSLNEITHDKLHLKSSLKPSSKETIVLNSSSLYNKYSDEIKRILYEVELTDYEYVTYRFQPKLFCYHYYGTTELWSLLLKVNNMMSVAQFDKKKIIMFSGEIFKILSEILVLEDYNIRINKVNNNL